MRLWLAPVLAAEGMSFVGAEGCTGGGMHVVLVLVLSIPSLNLHPGGGDEDPWWRHVEPPPLALFHLSENRCRLFYPGSARSGGTEKRREKKAGRSKEAEATHAEMELNRLNNGRGGVFSGSRDYLNEAQDDDDDLEVTHPFPVFLQI